MQHAEDSNKMSCPFLIRDGNWMLRNEDKNVKRNLEYAAYPMLFRIATCSGAVSDHRSE